MIVFVAVVTVIDIKVDISLMGFAEVLSKLLVLELFVCYFSISSPKFIQN